MPFVSLFANKPVGAGTGVTKQKKWLSLVAGTTQLLFILKGPGRSLAFPLIDHSPGLGWLGANKAPRHAWRKWEAPAATICLSPDSAAKLHNSLHPSPSFQRLPSRAQPALASPPPAGGATRCHPDGRRIHEPPPQGVFDPSGRLAPSSHANLAAEHATLTHQDCKFFCDL